MLALIQTRFHPCEKIIEFFMKALIDPSRVTRKYSRQASGWDVLFQVCDML